MKIKPFINDYYLTIISDMITILENSTPGKRQWTIDPITGLPDYSSTLRSTFPDWSKFFYGKTPKREKLNYCLIDGPKPYEHGYFNGNTKEFLRILNNSKSGYLSKSSRVRLAWITAIEGFLDYIKDYEEQYGESYYKDDLEDCPF